MLLILTVGTGRYGLWDSKTSTYLLSGTYEDIAEHKHLLEELEQAQANRDHFEKLKANYIAMLTAPGSGNTLEEAEEFLKRRMPFLYS